MCVRADDVDLIITVYSEMIFTFENVKILNFSILYIDPPPNWHQGAEDHHCPYIRDGEVISVFFLFLPTILFFFNII